MGKGGTLSGARADAGDAEDIYGEFLMAANINTPEGDEFIALKYLMWASNRDLQHRIWTERRVNSRNYGFNEVLGAFDEERGWLDGCTRFDDARYMEGVIDLPWGKWANEQFAILDRRLNEVHQDHNLIFVVDVDPFEISLPHYCLTPGISVDTEEWEITRKMAGDILDHLNYQRYPLFLWGEERIAYQEEILRKIQQIIDWDPPPERESEEFRAFYYGLVQIGPYERNVGEFPDLLDLPGEMIQPYIDSLEETLYIFIDRMTSYRQDSTCWRYQEIIKKGKQLEASWDEVVESAKKAMERFQDRLKYPLLLGEERIRKGRVFVGKIKGLFAYSEGQPGWIEAFRKVYQEIVFMKWRDQKESQNNEVITCHPHYVSVLWSDRFSLSIVERAHLNTFFYNFCCFFHWRTHLAEGDFSELTHEYVCPFRLERFSIKPKDILRDAGFFLQAIREYSPELYDFS
ncbi:MAG: hypothetical protein VXZ72_01350 [Chlamydiota bacterium]|nr:hypothetical protein [Chlamydiota bacterium]